MSNATPPVDFASACGRLNRFVAHLGHVRGIAVTATLVEGPPPFDGGPKAYQVSLRNGNAETTLHVDHDALTDTEEFFSTLVVPQLDAAIASLSNT